MIINLAIEAEPNLCAWLVTEFARRRDSLAAMGSDAVAFTFDDVIWSLVWDAYDRATHDSPSESEALSDVPA